MSEAERADLADRLWRSIDGDTQEEVAASWAAEIKRRVEAADRGEGQWLTEEEVNRRLEAKMVEAFEDVLQTSIRYKTDLRTGAYIVAINRVATVTRMRGMYA